MITEGQNKGEMWPKADSWSKLILVVFFFSDSLVFFFSRPLGDTVYSSILLCSGLSTNLNSKVEYFVWGNGGGGDGDGCVEGVYWERKYK